MTELKFIEGGLDRVEVVELLKQHLQDMALHSPPESVHALDIDALKQADISFWGGWLDHRLAGCVALRQLDQQHAEIKSMRTARQHQRRGVGEQLLRFVLTVAESRGYQRLSLETGSMQAFYPARRLYQKFGFTSCEPFAEYVVDRNSVFMTKEL